MSGETWLVEAISRCIVEHCGVDDSEFIAAVENGTVVVANADSVAQAILEMPEMLLGSGGRSVRIIWRCTGCCTMRQRRSSATSCDR